MKRLAFISGTICSSLFVMGSLFKLMYWPGAGPLITLGLVDSALIAIPSIAVYQYNNDNSK